MNHPFQHARPWLACVAILGIQSLVTVHAAPGEDTIILKGPVKYLAIPTAPQPKSGNLDGPYDIPAWMRARMSRYVAKAYSATADDGTIYTDSDVVTSIQSEGLRKTCIQEVGSNAMDATDTFGTRYGPQVKEQVVVLRGDLVNVCR